jgi:tetratricopeptide (TPR) repeat protein
MEAGPLEIEAASFKGVTPGVSTAAEVEKAWGTPKEINRQSGRLVQLYAVEPFDRVEVSYTADKVAAIIIRLAQAFPADRVAEQLELTNVRPVLVANEMGDVLGQSYPERGVMFAFEAGDAPGKASMRVVQIVLEPVTAEPFVLRAENTISSRYQLSFNDLQQALKLDPQNARAHWLHARVLTAMGAPGNAATAAGQAVRLEPANAQYRVTRAQLLGQIGQVTEAMREGQKAVETSQKRPHVKARALCVLGDLATSGARPDYKRALQYHTEAITTADPLAASPHPAVRLAAKEVLVDAHLGAAHDIAWGTWREKEEAVERWLAKADAFAEDLVANESGSPEYRLRVAARALAACVGLQGRFDPARWTKIALETGEQLATSSEDPVRKAHFQAEVGMALYDTLQTYQSRGDHDTAMKYGELAVGHLEQGDPQSQTSSSSYLLGRLYFRMGAIYAIRDKDHAAAITWFDKAVPLLEKPLPREAQGDLGRHGETFVSMGVSYWEAGQQEKAVTLTQRGITLMEQAVKQGSLDESALAIPYGNLAAMHQQLGRHDQADRFHEMAGRIKDTKRQ